MTERPLLCHLAALLLLLLAPNPNSIARAEPFLFMDLQDLQAPWGLLQPRASIVARNASFKPPYAPAAVANRYRCRRGRFCLPRWLVLPAAAAAGSAAAACR